MVPQVLRSLDRVILCLLTWTLASLLYSCGELPKEIENSWVRLHLNLQSSAPSKLNRSGTETRGSELAVVVRTTTEFSEHGPDLSDVLDWNRVKTLDNTVSLLLPTNEKLYLFIYRFQENHTSYELEQWLLGQLPLLNPIDFGKSEVFSVSNTESTLIINGERSSTLTIQFARQ